MLFLSFLIFCCIPYVGIQSLHASFSNVRFLYSSLYIEFFLNAAITQTRLIIDGQFVEAADGATFDTIDPRTGKVIAAIACAGAEDINRAVKAARKAFDFGPWPRMSGRDRGVIMMKFADLLESHKDELAALETLDNGKPLAMSVAADIPLTVEHYR